VNLPVALGIVGGLSIVLWLVAPDLALLATKGGKLPVAPPSQSFAPPAEEADFPIDSEQPFTTAMLGPEKALAHTKADLRKLGDMLWVDFHAKPDFPHGTISGEPASDGEVAAYADVFIPEFCLYPPAVMGLCNVRRIVFCKNLSVGGAHVVGSSDVASGTLYFDASDFGSTAYHRHVIHRELFRMIDQAQGYEANRDDRWASLNREDFKYGDQSVVDWGGRLNSDPGFLTSYSTLAVREDKAEVFACLISYGPDVKWCVRSDSIVRAKAALLKERLFRFCPEFDDAFWARARRVNRSN
jgi:hypothetical protein